MADTILTAPTPDAAPATPTAEPVAPAAAPAVVEPNPKVEPAAPAAVVPAVEPAKAEPIEVKLPEGVEADPTLIEALKGAAKDSKGAQALLDTYVAAQAKAVEQQKTAWEQTQKTWVESLKTDKDFGGAQFDANLQTARKAVTRFGSPELKAFLDESGLGNHPEIVRTFARIGKAIAEDSIAGVTAPPPGQKSEEDLLRALYPNTPSMFPKES
jgi:hypothetical protein